MTLKFIQLLKVLMIVLNSKDILTIAIASFDYTQIYTAKCICELTTLIIIHYGIDSQHYSYTLPVELDVVATHKKRHLVYYSDLKPSMQCQRATAKAMQVATWADRDPLR